MLNSSEIYYVRNGYIYIRATMHGKRYRFSTKKKATESNLKWIRRNALSVLLNYIDEEEEHRRKSNKLENFGYEVLELTSHKRDRLTQEDYLSLYERYIIPHFKMYNIQDIKVFDIEHWQKMLLSDLSTSRVLRIKTIFSMILKKAVANDMILKNPVDYVESFKVSYSKQEPFSLDEMKAIINGASGWLKVLLSLAFSTGMRAGEILALQWNDIDFENRAIYLQRSISKGVIKGDTQTKNHNRLVVVPDFVMDMLRIHKNSSINEWVFVSRYKKPYTESKGIAKCYFKPLLEKLGISYKPLKATRHTYVSIMRNSGVNADFVNEIVGHSKDVSNKHYYTAHVNMQKVEAVNNVFHQLKVLDVDTNVAH